jgi:restriction endonuclease S subunit
MTNKFIMTYSIIQKSQLEGAKRLDAEYYQPELLDIVKNLQKYKVVKLKDILDDIRYGLYVEPDYQDKGVNFLRALNLVESGIDGEILKIKEKEIPSKKYLLKIGDILIVRSGANTGNIGIIEKNLENSTFGSYTICLRTEKLNPYFLYSFLNSKFGRLQTKRLQTGMAQPNLNIPNIEEIRIPLNIKKESQEKIEKIILDAFAVKEDSKNLYHQAENLLLEALGLKDYKGEDSLYSVVKLSEVKAAWRMDAEYFNGGWQAVERKLKNTKTAKLGELVEMKKGVEPGAEEYREEGKLFIRVSSLSKFGVNTTEEKYLSEELYKKLKDDFEPQVGEILLTKDATPGVAYVLKEKIEGIIAGGVLRLKLNSQQVEDEYLALCFNSIIGQLQAQRDAGGSVIAHWKPEQIKKVVIPLLPKPSQQKIADLVRRSHQVRKKAKELLEEAKRRVEEMIEEN